MNIMHLHFSIHVLVLFNTQKLVHNAQLHYVVVYCSSVEISLFLTFECNKMIAKIKYCSCVTHSYVFTEVINFTQTHD